MEVVTRSNILGKKQVNNVSISSHSDSLDEFDSAYRSNTVELFYDPLSNGNSFVISRFRDCSLKIISVRQNGGFVVLHNVVVCLRVFSTSLS